MARRKSTGPVKRDMFGQAHGAAGKGDKSRVTDQRQYLANLAEVDLPGHVEGLIRQGTKLVKVYGTPARPVARSPFITVH